MFGKFDAFFLSVGIANGVQSCEAQDATQSENKTFNENKKLDFET